MKRASKITYKQENDYLRVPSDKTKIPPKADKYNQMNKQCHFLLISMVFLIFYSTPLIAQDSSQTPPVFPLGVWATGEPIDDQRFFNSLDSSGLNTLLISVSPDNNTLLEPYKVITQNGESQQEAVYHYSNGMYTKWEAENLQENTLRTGILHTFGSKAFYDGDSCWTTGNDAPPRDSLIYGPHYRQDKNYRLIYWKNTPNERINFTVKYSLALGEPSENPLDEVCEIKVVFCYKDSLDVRQCDTLALETKTVANFPDNSFQPFYLEYTYPEEFDNPVLGPEGDSYEAGNFAFDDTEHNTGIEFQLDWLGTGTLYVDYVEVYDNAIWKRWVDPLKRDSVVSEISTFLSTYSGSEWNDIIKYWFGKDEPQSIDYYEPMRVVDSLIRTMPGGRPLITQFYPQWNGWRNGDRTIPKFMQLTNPDKLMFWNFPFKVGLSNEFGLSLLSPLLQEASENDPEFWFVGQGIAQRTQSGQECGWRKPDSMELKASVMLALAHGAKGILFYKYSSTDYLIESATCQDSVWFDAIVGTRGESYLPSPLWYVIHDNLAPRLGGRLGKTLQKLKYENKYINFNDSKGEEGMLHTVDYLSIVQSGQEQFYHAGLLLDSNNTDNKYFLLTNLLTDTTDTRVCRIYINYDSYLSGYNNWRFRNVENGIDTTLQINNYLQYDDTLQAGEGHLFQVAPVVKYGGRLIYDEEITSSTTLYDEMTIENGAKLYISRDYNCYANIIVKDGEIIRSGNGKLIFHNGFKLIVAGSADINGTAQNKLEVNFSGALANNGILVDSLGSLDIKNCLIKNAEI